MDRLIVSSKMNKLRYHSDFNGTLMVLKKRLKFEFVKNFLMTCM
jgi:hypothetical protein